MRLAQAAALYKSACRVSRLGRPAQCLSTLGQTRSALNQHRPIRDRLRPDACNAAGANVEPRQGRGSVAMGTNLGVLGSIWRRPRVRRKPFEVGLGSMLRPTGGERPPPARPGGGSRAAAQRRRGFAPQGPFVPILCRGPRRRPPESPPTNGAPPQGRVLADRSLNNPCQENPNPPTPPGWTLDALPKARPGGGRRTVGDAPGDSHALVSDRPTQRQCAYRHGPRPIGNRPRDAAATLGEARVRSRGPRWRLSAAEEAWVLMESRSVPWRGRPSAWGNSLWECVEWALNESPGSERCGSFKCGGRRSI